MLVVCQTQIKNARPLINGRVYISRRFGTARHPKPLHGVHQEVYVRGEDGNACRARFGWCGQVLVFRRA